MNEAGKYLDTERPDLPAPVASLGSVALQEAVAPSRRRAQGVLFSAALTAGALLVHGYHPYVEDGGLYLTGVKRVLDPSLYPALTSFVTVHLRFSFYAPMVAAAVHLSHIGIMGVLFCLYVGTIWLTLFAAWQIAIRCYRSAAECFSAVSLLAAMLTVPIAGTSLMLMDPYVSARSFSTPCSLLAFVGALDIAHQSRSGSRLSVLSAGLCGGSLLVAALLHPLMAAYAFGCILLLACASLPNRRANIAATVAACIAAILVAAALNVVSPAAAPGYKVVAYTRAYWFLSTWQWYEVLGVLAPLLVLAGLMRRRNDVNADAARPLAQMAIVSGWMGILVALLFAHENSPNFAVARLQPLRIFQTVYIVMILAVGAALGRYVLARQGWRWAGFFLALTSLMYFVQQRTFPASSHLELPVMTISKNEWSQAFLWIRDHTPKNAVFAMDANYITYRGEDSQNFRAIAERSALPDYSKDGGLASIAPDLTAAWLQGETAQKNLNALTDAERIRQLPADVTWIVLPLNSSTAFRCDYKNDSVKVCRVGR
jgi:hypothetical protein